MKELILVRHGESEHMTRGLTGGWTDVPLTERGREQARLTGMRLAEMLAGRCVAFYSSDLIRTAETSELISGLLGVTASLTTGLRELNNGDAKNLTHEDASRIALPITDPAVDWRPYPGAESWAEMSARVHAFLDSIRDNGEDTALIVTHGNSGNAVVNWWLGLGTGSNIHFEIDPCSISWFGVSQWGERAIIRLNDTGHLD